ncbi:ephrin-A5-like protein, partial [Leptotrombidium deliense]
FRIDNTDHIIDVNKGNNPFEYDQVNIICPTYSKGTREDDTESYIIYNVRLKSACFALTHCCLRAISLQKNVNDSRNY